MNRKMARLQKGSAMKTTGLSMAIAAVLLIPPAYAVDEHHPDKAAIPEKAAPSAKTPRPAPKSPVDEKSMAQMQDHMKKMQDIMARMQKTTDPAERKKLMDQHMKTMQEGMQMMNGMGGGMMQGMMGGGMMGQAPKDGAALSGPMGRGAPMSPEMMERRMDMMQMMMEQMMEHQKAQEAAPK
jgi:hypothetical protein